MPPQQVDTEGELEVQLGEVPDTSSRYIVDVTPEKYVETTGQDEDEKKDHQDEFLDIDGNQTNFAPNRRLTERHSEDVTSAGQLH